MDYERFAPLVTPHTAAMARVAAALVDFPDAEDAAQEALVRAWRAWPSLREPDSTRAWLMRITVNVCRSWRTRGQGLRHTAEERLDSALFTFEAGESALGASEHLSALDVRQALLALSEDMRVVVALRFYVGMDSTEIGQLLGESSATIRSRLRRAIISLRRVLDEVGTVPAELDLHSGRNA
jgi:RNA polymerase sigma-70 factor (ECF subfamily)